MAEYSDFFYPSSDGRNKIHARVCTPSSKPKAVIQIVHGIAEHINRYDEFMALLAENGYVACGEDHLGHGQSFGFEADRGFFAEHDGWQRVVDDVDTLRTTMHVQYPGIPYVFFGHSMGSFLTRTYLIRHPERYDAAIISGTGQQSPALVAAGKAAAQLLVLTKGARGAGDMLNNMAFGSYCAKIENPRTPFDWLSRDAANVDKYIADPLCGFVAKVSLYRDMMTGIQFISKAKNLSTMNKEAPVYFMSGAEDPVGDYGAGVEKAYKAFCNAGMKDVFLRLYPGGRHEMLNELNRELVWADLTDWLNSRIRQD